MAVGERPQERAQRRRRPHPENSRAIPPERSRSKSSIESAPASIPATTAPVFTAAFGDATLNPATSPGQPAASASLSTGSNPAADTRFGSSNTARTV